MLSGDRPVIGVNQDQLKGQKTWRDQAPDFQLVIESLSNSGLVQSDWAIGPNSSPVIVDFRGVNVQDYVVWIQGEKEPLTFKLQVQERLLDKLREVDSGSKLNLEGFDSVTEQNISFPFVTQIGDNSDGATLKIENASHCWVLVGSKKINLVDAQ